MALVPCIAVSTAYILLTMFLSEVSRKIVKAVTPAGLLRTALNEAIAGAELCGCCFELIIIADNYGVSAYAVYLFLLTIWWSQHWEEATACPYTHFEDFIQGSMTVLEVGVRTAAAVFGGVAIFKYIQILWSLEIAETHVGRSHSSAYGKCSADLTVPVMYGAAIEGVATLLCRLSSKFLSDREPAYANFIDSFVGTSLVVAAFSTSGGYFNPVLATGLKFGCKGHTHIEHGIVYWIGSSAGAIASVYIYPTVRNLLGVKPKTE